jgi:predicted RNA-binding Zn-ribbon protein involved in translation (DUF1610 family)
MSSLILSKEDIFKKIGKYTHYTCPNCQKNYILNIYNYCPMCGESITIEGEI